MTRRLTIMLPLFAALAALTPAGSAQPGPAQPPAVKAAQEKVKAADGRVYATGWVKDKAAVNRVLNRIKREGKEPTLEKAAPDLLRKAGANDPVFFWHSERKVLGKVLDSWDQGQVGSCVGFGHGRGAQDTLLNEAAAGKASWPGKEISPEVIYGGSRVEVGGGGIDGDGSVGAWAAEWHAKYGEALRQKYATIDLTNYSERLCRELGDRGIPDDVEAFAKLHPIKEVALVTTADGLWAALGAGKSVPVCSNQGFTTQRDRDGFCQLSGSWAHCMVYRGRFVHPTRGRCVVEQNSWGDYLGSANNKFKYVDSDGATREETLPMGCFCVELNVAARALREEDTFALAGVSGWDAVPPAPPTPPGPNPPQPPTPFMNEVKVEVNGMQFVLDFKNKVVTVPEGWKTNVPIPPVPMEPTLQEQLNRKGLTPEQIELILKIIELLLKSNTGPVPTATLPGAITAGGFAYEFKHHETGPATVTRKARLVDRILPGNFRPMNPVRRLIGR